MCVCVCAHVHACMHIFAYTGAHSPLIKHSFNNSIVFISAVLRIVRWVELCKKSCSIKCFIIAVEAGDTTCRCTSVVNQHFYSTQETTSIHAIVITGHQPPLCHLMYKSYKQPPLHCVIWVKYSFH